MKWYISGKISGLPTDQVTAKFKQAEQQIRAFGHECDAIDLLKDWGDSRGSRLEANIAEECGLQIVHQPEYATYESRM